VTLGDDVTAALPALRAQAESLQTDACTVTHPGTGEGTFDPVTGATTPPVGTTVYAGQCRFRAPTLSEANVSAGEHVWTVQDAVLSLPVTATGVQVGDTAVCTASQMDPDLPETVWTVMAVLRGSQITARRLIVRQATS
jgi:uncharacterized protein DUF6093